MKAFEPLWGNWYLQETIGAGSYGTVYKARQEMFGYTYYSAVKHFAVPKDEVELMQVRDGLASDDEEILNMFFEEKIQSLIREYNVQRLFSGNPHFVQVYDVLSRKKAEMTGYDLFIRMELLNGLNTRFQGDTGHEKEAVRLAMDVLDALSEMHARHMIHRDIKVQNILVSDEGVYKLADFGEVQEIMGDRSFMSIKGNWDTIAPEIINRQPVGFTADLYSFGLVLYRLLNRHLQPFMTRGDFNTEKAAMRRLRGETLPPPSEASPEMAEIILKACAYDPKDRWASAKDMLEAVRAIGKPKAPPKPQPKPDPAPPKPQEVPAWTGELEKLRKEMDAFGADPASEETCRRLEQIRSALSLLPAEMTAVIREKKRCEALLEKCRTSLMDQLLQRMVNLLVLVRKKKQDEEKASAKAASRAVPSWQSELAGLKDEMDACRSSLSEEETLRRLEAIGEKLSRLPDVPEVQQEKRRFDALLEGSRRLLLENLMRRTQNLSRAAAERKQNIQVPQDITVEVLLTSEENRLGCVRNIDFIRYERCEVCHGSGTVQGMVCHECSGNRLLGDRKTVRATFTPHPGCREYSVVMRGEGNDTLSGGRGNLLMRVRVQEPQAGERQEKPYAPSQKAEAGEDITVPLTITKKENLAGCRKKIEYQKAVVCPACSGSGRWANGTVCASCSGEKRVYRPAQTQITLEARRFSHDYTVNLRSQGNEGLFGGAAGNLLVKVHVQDEQKETPSAPVQRAMAGGDVTVPITITERENLTECRKSIQYDRLVRCPACKGSGVWADGTVCATCLGEKRVHRETETEITLAPHPDSSDYTVSVRNQGNEGLGGTNGNLLVKVHVQKDVKPPQPSAQDSATPDVRINGSDVLADLIVTSRENRQGCLKSVLYSRYVKCPACSGTGRDRGGVCGSCHGTRRIMKNDVVNLTLSPREDRSMYTKMVRGMGNEGIRERNGNLLVRIRVID